MIIDLILDRKDGEEYNARKFYNDVMGYYNTMPEIAGPIAETLDGSEFEEDIRRELSLYVIANDYNFEIVKYIQSVDWLK
jgi:hypothetical protein